MKVKDLMWADKLKVCSPESKVAKVAKVMKESNKGALPVVNEKQKVIGILTDRDMALALASTRKKTAELTVKDVLRRTRLHTVRAEDEITDALRQMRKNKIGRLPVTDEEGRLQGMISVNNILSRAVRRNEAIGTLSSKSENIAKTIAALYDRNNSSLDATKEKKP